jgi:hypothetical protein
MLLVGQMDSRTTAITVERVRYGRSGFHAGRAVNGTGRWLNSRATDGHSKAPGRDSEFALLFVRPGRGGNQIVPSSDNSKCLIRPL